MLKDKIKEKEKVILQINTELDTKNRSLEKSSSECVNLKQENSTLSKQATDLKSQVESLKRINAYFEKENKKFAQDKKSLIQENMALRKENDGLKGTIVQLRRRNDALEQETSKHIRHTEDLRKQLELQRKRTVKGIIVFHTDPDSYHYENTPTQIYWEFTIKKWKLSDEKFW